MNVLIGRAMQLSGMILLPIGLIYGLGYDQIRTEVKLLAIGGALYLIGWVLAKKPGA
jgi:high-affinity nickel permease